MPTFDYDRSYEPSAPVISVGLGLPGESEVRHTLRALVDSGADATMIPRDVLRNIGARFVERRTLQGVTGVRMQVSVYLVVVHLPLDAVYGVRAIAGTPDTMAILGRDVLNQWRVVLDGPAETVEVEL